MQLIKSMTLATAAALSLAACSSPEGTRADEVPTEEEAAAAQREIVENAVRRAYEAEGAEVTEIAMELSPNGSRYVGRAVVRDPESGTELTVDCRYYTDVTGAPQLSCDRVNNPE
jgi:hypothetical protein